MSYVVTAGWKDWLKTGLEVGSTIVEYGPDAIKLAKEYGPKIEEAIKKYGPQALKAIQTYGPQAIALIQQYGPEAVKTIQTYGPQAFEMGQQLATSAKKTTDFFDTYKWPLIIGGGGLALLLVLNVAKR